MAQDAGLSALPEPEREAVLRVLRRDRAVRSVEEQRVRKLTARLQQLRWKGGRSAGPQPPGKACARCRCALGLLRRRGAVCQGCSHCVCPACRVPLGGTRLWRCTVCFEGRNVRIKTGEWFFEERAKKFPTEGRAETAGAKLLQSYESLSSGISVVPPTPPPLSESWHSGSPGRLQELGRCRGFNKSVENLFLSVTTHMKKLSKSQNDVASDKQLLSAGPRPGASRTERRSQSDTAISATPRKASAPDILMPLSQERPTRPTGPASKQDGLPAPPAPSTSLSGSRRGSLMSVNSTCTEIGNFDNAAVTGEIEFAIRYCFETRSLEIHVQACRGLAYGEERRKGCNPYVKTYLLPDRSAQGKRKTGVQRNTVDPAFRETLKYQVELAQLVTRRLQVSVWHAGTLARRVFLGEVVVPLAAWDFADSSSQAPRWHALRAK